MYWKMIVAFSMVMSWGQAAAIYFLMRFCSDNSPVLKAFWWSIILIVIALETLFAVDEIRRKSNA